MATEEHALRAEGARDRNGSDVDEEELERRHFGEVVNAMRYYRYHALSEIARRERHIARMPEHHKALFPEGSMHWKIDALKRAAHLNALFLEVLSEAPRCVVASLATRRARPAHPPVRPPPPLRSPYSSRFGGGEMEHDGPSHSHGGVPCQGHDHGGHSHAPRPRPPPPAHSHGGVPCQGHDHDHGHGPDHGLPPPHVPPRAPDYQMSKVLGVLHTCVRDWAAEVRRGCALFGE